MLKRKIRSLLEFSILLEISAEENGEENLSIKNKMTEKIINLNQTFWGKDREKGKLKDTFWKKDYLTVKIKSTYGQTRGFVADEGN